MPWPQRILWLTWKDRSHPLAGGAEVVNEAIAQRLVRAGAQIVFIVGGFDGGSASEERDGYRIERVGNRFTCYYHAWRKVRRDYRGWADLVIDEINTVPFFAGWYAGKKRRGVRMHDVPSSASQGEELEVRVPLNPSSQPSPLRGEGASDGMLRPTAEGLSNGKIPVILFVHQLCRQIWFYQLPWSVAWVGYLLEPLYLRLLSRFPAVTVSESTKRDLMRYGFREECVSVIGEGITLEPLSSLDPEETGLGSSPSSACQGEELEVRVPLNPSSQPFPLRGEGVHTETESKPLSAKGVISGKAPDPTVLLLGAIREMKRTDHAIRAYELARDVIPDLKLVIAGPVARERRARWQRLSYGEKVLDLIAASRHASDITYEGRVDEARKTELMRTSHVLLSCAVKEGWGLTITEANSQGTPAIVYDADGLRDSVRHGQTGLVCRPTPQAMAAAVVSLLSDHATYERLRRAGWEWSKTMTFDRAAEDFVAAIDSLAGFHGEPACFMGHRPSSPWKGEERKVRDPVPPPHPPLSPEGRGEYPTPTTHPLVSVPLVSVIVPTLNSAKTLERCLTSIRAQTYGPIELIVVDNFSTDDTMDIAQRLADKVYQQGPERSAQRNRGAKEATGEWVVFIDSDMVLTENVIADCVAVASESVTGVIIPEESFGEGFWAQCKKLERSFYVGVDGIEAARFIRRDVFDRIGGYDEEMVSGEDWDLSQRVAKQGKLARTSSFILHDEGHLSLTRTLRKKFYYARQFGAYLARNRDSKELGGQVGIVSRYMLFFRHPTKLFANPIQGLGMLFMKTAEFGVGGLGLVSSKFHN